MLNYAKFYDLEKYLFTEVSTRFAKEKGIGAFDFFCIVIWKANRAKTRIAKLLTKGGHTLEKGARALTRAVAGARDNKERLRILIRDWKLRLPIASAVLTVLYPEKFTVYDGRVCDQLRQKCERKYGSIQDRKFDAMWEGYEAYVKAVRVHGTGCSLRDKDKALWGADFHNQLTDDVKQNFARLKRRKSKRAQRARGPHRSR